MALPDILSELEACGYRTRTFLIPACAVGARHRRYRVAIVGYAEHNVSSSTTVSGVFKKTGNGQPKGEETPGEPAGTGKPGNRAAMGRTGNVGNPDCIGCGEQGNVCKQPGRAEFKRTSKNLADENGKRELQQDRYQQNIGNGASVCCENVQHPDSAGCEEQHISKKSKRQEFSGWVFDEGNGCNVFNSDNGSGTMRRNRELSTAEETEGARDDFGGRAQEHEPGERRSAESVLGGMASRISDRVDGGVKIETDIKGTVKNLPGLREGNETQTIWKEARGFGGTQAKGVLQQRMYGERLSETEAGRIGSTQKSKKVFEGQVRNVWDDEKSSSTSYRHESVSQHTGEHHDALLFMSYEIPLGAWENIDKKVSEKKGQEALDFLINHYWDVEPDIPRIATGIEHRVDRLKCLGNAVVPQQFYPIFRAIAEIERGGTN